MQTFRCDVSFALRDALRAFSVAGWGGRRPRISGHEASQDGERVVAVLACGVDVAADIEPVLGGVFAGEPAGYLLLSFQRPDAVLADVVRGPSRRVQRPRRTGCDMLTPAAAP